ncbi:MAG: hypothetical protein LBU92_01050, partial [Prevotellaceae bacterium]|nr:hypothetical protein [Prevotellaceae bacterium]
MNNDKTCLRFSNEEIIEYLIKPLRNYPELDIYFDFEDDSILQDKKMREVPSTTKIEHISFEGYEGDFSLHFFTRHI